MEPVGADVLIVGAGPVGLFAAFQLGLFGMQCHLIDSLDRPGGQCAMLYADKPIYDVPGLPVIEAALLVEKLQEQIAPFAPGFSFGRTVVEFAADSQFRLTAHDGGFFEAPVIVVATGCGAFDPVSRVKESPLADWGIGFAEGAVPVDTEKFQTCLPGVFAIGDAAGYPGKVPLLLSGFHEAALMTQAVRKMLKPAGRAGVQYTSSSTVLRKRLGV
jgi:thioredoxin reductase (NADPH)